MQFQKRGRFGGLPELQWILAPYPYDAACMRGGHWVKGGHNCGSSQAEVEQGRFASASSHAA